MSASAVPRWSQFWRPHSMELSNLLNFSNAHARQFAADAAADCRALALLLEIRTEPTRREGPARNERRGRILDVFDRGVRQRAGTAAASATGEFQSVVRGTGQSNHNARAMIGNRLKLARSAERAHRPVDDGQAQAVA